MFSGTKSQWRSWKLEIEGKIDEDAAAIGNSKSQLRDIYSRLEGAAKTNITTFFELETKGDYPNPQALLNRLEILYGERNRKDKAIQALHTIRQREDESFTAFYPRFEKEIANAEAESWEDSSKISYLRNALHQKLKRYLIGCPGKELQSYAAFAMKCEEISNQMELFGEWSIETKDNAKDVKKQVLEPRTHGSKVPSHRENMMEWEPTTTVSIQTANTRKNLDGYHSKRPEDQALLGKRAKWVAKAELDSRRREGRCFRCGRDGCRIERCPLAAAIPPTGTTTYKISTSRARVTEAAVEENFDTALEQ